MSEADGKKAPKLPPGSVKIHDQESHCWRTFKVVLPETCVMQDLQDHPGLFAGHGLREDDELYVVAHDRSWCVTARVITAAPDRIHLSKPVVNWSGLESRSGVEYEDELFEASWDGDGYAFFRKGVGTRARTKIRGGFATLAAAKTAISREYPKRV